MNVAVLTLTRDRLTYSQHCFQTLRDNAGCEFDWFVLDNGSTDGTAEWLLEQDDITSVLLGENVGICRGLNLLLDEALNPADYDVIVRFDNDCEVLHPDTLDIIAILAMSERLILAPRVLGLRNPPPTIQQVDLGRGWVMDETAILGGIFMAIPAGLFRHFRYDERHEPWTGDEAICSWFRERAGRCGYLKGYAVNHYLTTDGQEADDPGYWARKTEEMTACR